MKLFPPVLPQNSGTPDPYSLQILKRTSIRLALGLLAYATALTGFSWVDEKANWRCAPHGGKG
jgi:hypothetical protein